MSPDYLVKSLPLLRAKLSRGETLLSVSAIKRIDAVIESFMMAIDVAGPRTKDNDLVHDVRDCVRHCLGALYVFELNGLVRHTAETELVEVLEAHGEAVRAMVVAHRKASA